MTWGLVKIVFSDAGTGVAVSLPSPKPKQSDTDDKPTNKGVAYIKTSTPKESGTIAVKRRSNKLRQGQGYIYIAPRFGLFADVIGKCATIRAVAQ